MTWQALQKAIGVKSDGDFGPAQKPPAGLPARSRAGADGIARACRLGCPRQPEGRRVSRRYPPGLVEFCVIVGVLAAVAAACLLSLEHAALTPCRHKQSPGRIMANRGFAGRARARTEGQFNPKAARV
jgi:hypothetical protein